MQIFSNVLEPHKSVGRGRERVAECQCWRHPIDVSDTFWYLCVFFFSFSGKQSNNNNNNECVLWVRLRTTNWNNFYRWDAGTGILGYATCIQCYSKFLFYFFRFPFLEYIERFWAQTRWHVQRLRNIAWNGREYIHRHHWVWLSFNSTTTTKSQYFGISQ